MIEEQMFWGHAVYRDGELLHEGANPIPDGVVEQATEIRWIADEPTVEQPEGEEPPVEDVSVPE